MAISLEADQSLAQGYLKINGVTAATVTSTGLTTASLQNAAVTPAKLAQPYTLATEQASTSGTSIDFTGIPSWAKRITILFSEVSTSGTNSILVQLGDAGGLETSGYVSTSNTTDNAGSSAGVNRTDGFCWFTNNAANASTGSFTILQASGNAWVASHSGKMSTTHIVSGGGSKTLSDTLTQLRITTVGGTDTFDAGTINIAYEG